ncbi:MAG TPA: family 1 encapsulin nanocompartment shell protein [Polyangiaceae bacterium]
MGSSNPLTEAQWQFIQEEAIREARRTLVVRRFLGVYGPLGVGIESVALEEYGPDADAEIEIEGKHDPDPIVAVRKKYVRVPIIYKDFVLHWRDVELSRKLGAPLDASRAIRAAHFVADREDQFLFHGEPKFGIEGLLNCSGRHHVERGDWSKYGQAYRDVVRAAEILLEHNHHRPFALAVSARDYARLVQQKEGQFAPEIDAIMRLCDDGVYTSPAIPDGSAVMLSTGDQNVDIAVAEDLTIAFLGEQDQDYPFRVYECLALRVKRPQAICTLGAALTKS